MPRPRPPTARDRPRRCAGLTLVEAALIVSVMGILLAVFIPTFFRELRTSKISEAATQLQALHVQTAAYYAARHDVGDGPRVTRCLPSAGGPVPERPSVDAVAVDFADESVEANAPFRAVGFAPRDATRYRYTFVPVKDGCDLQAPAGRPVLTLRAEGDLDGDGKLSLFERRATTDAEGNLVPVGVLQVTSRTE